MMPETALVVSPTAGTAPTVLVRQPAIEAEARIIIGLWRAVTNESAVPVDVAASAEEPGWQPAEVYEARLAELTAESAAQADAPWEPDTPEQAADRHEMAEALLDEQLGVITRDHRD